MVDAVALKCGLFINAAKKEVTLVGQLMALPTFQLSGKKLLVTDSSSMPREQGTKPLFPYLP
eukprot:366141-Chlamydomonas_euryale.AAC.1